MFLETLLNEPQLIEIKIDKPEFVEKFGEAITFYIYDRQDLDTYMQLAKLSGEGSVVEMANITKKLIRDKSGKLILEGKGMLPPDVMMSVIEESIKQLGNLIAQTTPEPVEK
jgi:hypothetical protein|tara:strand:- start:2407 stop:2742 length:336 start_codon:yes stop_codon:yes gene_type:complete